MTGLPAIDGWEVHGDWHPELVDIDPWRALLEHPDYRRGLARITLEVFLGRSGWRTMMSKGCSDKDGNPIDDATASAVFDAEAALDQLRQAVETSWEVHSHTVFQLALWRLSKKGGTATKAEHKVIRLNKDGSVADDQSGATGIGREGLRLLDMQNRAIDRLLSSHITIAKNYADAQTSAMEHMTSAMDIYRRASEAEASVLLRPTPADINQRWESATRNLGEGFSVLAQHVGPLIGLWVHNKMGGGRASHGGAPDEPPPDQQAAQEFWQTLDGDQLDALRDAFGAPLFGQIVAVVHGDALQWMRERNALVALLQKHQNDLMRILRPDQLQKLLRINQ